MYKFIQHIPYYTPLVGILGASMVGFFAFSFDRQFQIGLLVAAAISFVIWGIVYHTIHRDLAVAIVLEYILFAALGVVAVISVLS